MFIKLLQEEVIEEYLFLGRINKIFVKIMYIFENLNVK